MNINRTNFETFQTLAERFKTVSVYQCILADLLTPIAVYLRMIPKGDYAFLLESVEKGTRYARYSYLGINPRTILVHQNGVTQVKNGANTTLDARPFLEILREIQRSYQMAPIAGLPTFTGGLVGYLGYETISQWETIPTHPESETTVPDSIFMLFEKLIVFDHLKGTMLLFCNVNVTKDRDLRDQLGAAHHAIDLWKQQILKDIRYQIPQQTTGHPTKSNFKKKEFKRAVMQAKEYIASGELFQVVLSQRFQRQTSVAPITLYRALRTINPSPYMFHLKMSNLDLIGASPELLVKVENRTVEVRPIAGTRPRGKTEKEDRTYAEAMQVDEKECAEHLMLLDLGRNDVGRVADFGTVQVPEKMVVERYSHVMHLVSSVQGRLREDRDVFDVLRSCFPAGTVTGAPKIRAMEIIYELEPERRGVYSGAVGYFDFCGNLNTCIAIRTMVMQGKEVHFQVGAGIVYDSQPEQEYHEVRNKAQALMTAIDLAERGLGPL